MVRPWFGRHAKINQLSIAIFTISFYFLLINTSYAKTIHSDKRLKNNHTISKEKMNVYHGPWWSLEVAFGLGTYSDLSRNNQINALTRIGISTSWMRHKQFEFGTDIGVLSETSGRLHVSQDKLDLMGGLPIDATIKPGLDLLFTTKYHFPQSHAFFSIIKAGVIYRQFDLHRCTIDNPSRLAPELQLGIGYKLSRYASISLLYQGIFDRSTNLQVMTSNNCDNKATVSGIPSLNSLMIGVSIHLN